MNNIKNVSFIVIALNEERAIGKCLDSIADLSMTNCQVICVDSDSKDMTLKIMMSYTDKIDNMEIYKVTGDVNASIARNIGIKAAVKKYILFLDGDTEINGEFISESIKLMETSFYSAVKGGLKEHQYAAECQGVRKITDRERHVKTSKAYLSGGNFIARKEAVKRTGLFNETMSINEDCDFALRFTKKHDMAAIPIFMGIHHTIPYYHRNQAWKGLLKIGFFNGRTLRNNLSNLKGLFFLFLDLKGLVAGLFFYILLLFSLLSQNSFFLWTLFLVFVIDILWGLRNGTKNMIGRAIIHYISPFSFLYGILTTATDKKTYYIEEVFPDNS